MKIRSTSLALTALMAAVSMASCDTIFDNQKDCPRGVYVNVYNQTECADEATYPTAIKTLHIFAFDEKGVLVADHKENDVTLSPSYECLVPMPGSGLYSFVSWANIDGHYSLADIKVGETTKDKLLLSLNRTNKVGADLSGSTLWVGETPAVQLLDMNNGGQEYTHTRANVQELTNRIHVMVERLANPQDYVIELASNNGSYRTGGGILPTDSTYYPSTMQFPADSTISARFTTLKLESGRENALIIRHLKTGKEIFREDLVGVILLSPSVDNINLRCLHDFEVKLKACPVCPDCPDYMIAEIWINDWLVHSYDISL